MNEDITPIRQQYLDIKRKYPDAILFFRLGDFYETFDQDAEITSRELDIVLTGRNVAKGVRIPMAGIPYHAVENYLSRLIDKGYHVAICEQMGNQPNRGLFPRQVVRVVTPGTIIEPGLLNSNSNNYLVSFFMLENKAGIAYVDITTGEFAVTELSSSDIENTLRAEIVRLSPAETIFPDSNKPILGLPGHLTPWAVWHFDPGRCLETIKSHYGVSTLEGFGLKDASLAIQAAGAIIQYIKETQPDALKLLTGLKTYSLADFMTLDAATRRNLELTETIRTASVQGSLLDALDQAVTPLGHRLLRQWITKPLTSIPAILERQNGIDLFVGSGLLRTEMRAILKNISDLERLTMRVVSGTANPRDLVAMRNTLQILPDIGLVFSKYQVALPAGLPLPLCAEERELLENSIEADPPATLQNTGVICRGYSDELDSIIEASQNAREWIANLEAKERERTGIKTLKVGFNKVFGYYLEITQSNSHQAPPEYIRKQTLVNAERYITPEMKEYESLVMNAEERIKELENRLFHEVCRQLSLKGEELLTAARTIATLDVFSALAETAVAGGYVRPELENSSVLKIRGGRHPVVEHGLKGERFVPNDLIFEDGEVVRIITGPNMSGKSTFLRQAALIVLMAQMGSYVPAEYAKIGIVDRIFSRIGAQDEIHAGQSTFMVEMIETANILHHATPRSLLILDEIGRGTSTYDGLSIAWSVVEYIHNHPGLHSRTLFATHYHELLQLADLLPGVRNYNVAVSEVDGTVAFLHKIVPGGSDRSYGIHVAQLAGLPGPVIQRARDILFDLEAANGHSTRINPLAAQQLTLFPETNPLLDELKQLDINSLSPIEALNKLFQWQKEFLKKDE
jgi:DNA mismatch repair protein MutS